MHPVSTTAATLPQGLREASDYPLAPGHTWADSHDALVDLAARLTGEWPTVLAGDSAGGGLALAVAQSLRDRGGASATHLLLQKSAPQRWQPLPAISAHTSAM